MKLSELFTNITDFFDFVVKSIWSCKMQPELRFIKLIINKKDIVVSYSDMSLYEPFRSFHFIEIFNPFTQYKKDISEISFIIYTEIIEAIRKL